MVALWLLLMSMASTAEYQTKMLFGSALLSNDDVYRELNVTEKLSGRLTLSTTEESRLQLIINDRHDITFEANSTLAINTVAESLNLILGSFVIECSAPIKLNIPQGIITCQAGVHLVTLDREKLILKTVKGRFAQLETADVVRRTKPNWKIVSFLSGSFSLVQEAQP